MPNNTATVASYGLLAGTSAYGLWGADNIYSQACFGLLFGTSLTGVWRWGVSNPGAKLVKYYEEGLFLRDVFCLPLVAALPWFGSTNFAFMGYVQLGLPFWPCYLRQKNKEFQDKEDLTVTLSAVSFGAFSFLDKRYMGLMAAVLFFLNYFQVKDKEPIKDIPSRELYNYVLTAFTCLLLF